MRTTYKIVAPDGNIEFIGASTGQQARLAAEALFPTKRVDIMLPNEDELAVLFASNTIDGEK